MGLGLPQCEEDLLAQHLLGNANADLGDAGSLMPRLDVVPQVVSQVEEPLPTADGDCFEIRLPKGELRAMLVQQTKLRGAAGVIGRDDEVEARGHGKPRYV